jgi:hypothetical protein
MARCPRRCGRQSFAPDCMGCLCIANTTARQSLRIYLWTLDPAWLDPGADCDGYMGQRLAGSPRLVALGGSLCLNRILDLELALVFRGGAFALVLSALSVGREFTSASIHAPKNALDPPGRKPYLPPHRQGHVALCRASGAEIGFSFGKIRGRFLSKTSRVDESAPGALRASPRTASGLSWHGGRRAACELARPALGKAPRQGSRDCPTDQSLPEPLGVLCPPGTRCFRGPFFCAAAGPENLVADAASVGSIVRSRAFRRKGFACIASERARIHNRCRGDV